MKNSKKDVSAKLPDNDSGIVCFRLVGTSPMLLHAFGQKSFVEMLEKMCQCRADGSPLDKEKEPKDLELEFWNAIPMNKRGEHAVPTKWIKAGMLSAASAGNKAINASALKRGAFVLGFTTPVLRLDGALFDTPEKQIDIVRVGSWNNRMPDVRARPRYDDWAVEVAVRVYPTQISFEEVVWVLDAMGKLVGLGDYRVENGGNYGQFEVESLSESRYSSIMKACGSPEKELVVPPGLMNIMRDRGVSPKQMMEETIKAKGGGKKVNGKSRPEEAS